MVLVTIPIAPELAEYARGKWFDPEIGAVHFPDNSDICVTVFDLMEKRPAQCPPDRGNLTLAVPCRRIGKSPQTYNYLTGRSIAIIEQRLRVLMWAELHDLMDENKHLRGIQFKETAYTFRLRYGIESISEDALLKNYQRWRDKMRRTLKRGYTKTK